MAQTNFAQLLDHQKKVWSLDVWKAAREHSFMNQFGGKGANNMVEHITDLTKSEKGDLAVIHLVNYLTLAKKITLSYLIFSQYLLHL